jgi:PRC-barrel domain
MQSMNTPDSLTRDRYSETRFSGHDSLIESDRVEGTAVYNREGDRLGTVRRFLVEKKSGKARYAEMMFGGFLGLGEDVHPLPWDVLSYDTDKGGYVVDLSKEQLTGAPRYGIYEKREFDRDYDREVRGYYGLPLAPF